MDLGAAARVEEGEGDEVAGLFDEEISQNQTISPERSEKRPATSLDR